MATPTPPRPIALAPRDDASETTALPKAPVTLSKPDAHSPRRSSFNFLRRKSSETRRRSVSGGKMSKKQKALAHDEFMRKQREAAMRNPPRLPQIQFGPPGEDGRPDSFAIVSNKAAGIYSQNFSRPSFDQSRSPTAPITVPVPVPAANHWDMNTDPYPSESMTHRGRYSYASSAISVGVNSPRRVRRRKDPTPFNILVVGGKSCGKSSFIEFLRTALALPAQKRPHTPEPPAAAVIADSPFTSQYLETEVDSERVGVTLWDSQGLEKSIVDFQLPVITAFLESKFEDTFTEEQKVVRAPGVRDTHIHCVFLILDPARLDANIAESKKANSKIVGGLDDELDLNVLRELQGRTTVIPIISKADTITTAHMRHLKKMVWDTLKRAKLDPLEALRFDESEDEGVGEFDEREEDAYVHDGDSEVLAKVPDQSSDAGSDASSTRSGSQSPPTSPPSAKKNHVRKPSIMSISLEKEAENPFLPLSIISPDPYEPEVIGRKFPWGFADPYNEEHCDFVKLRESVFSEWRAELRETSREQWYEGWRTQRLQKVPAQRRVTTSDGLASKQLSAPTQNGRAASAGRDARHHRSTPY